MQSIFVIVIFFLCHLTNYLLFQPPIQVFGLEGRYATALYSAASKTKQLDSVEKELVNLQVCKIILM